MTKKEFLKLEKKIGFTFAMRRLLEEKDIDCIWDIDTMEQELQNAIDEYAFKDARKIMDAMDIGCEYWKINDDYSIKAVLSVDDIEEFLEED